MPQTDSQAKNLAKVVIRFAGDSGDGMQLTGTEFTKAAAIAGNDISTFPDFPAEIRAPAGSLAGVSGFQLHFSSNEIHTPGDAPDVLVAMNPAAFKTNVGDLNTGGILIVNTGAFVETNLKKAGYDANPLDDETLADRFRLHSIDISELTVAALEESELSTKEKGRCKNFFALGLLYWMYSRDPELQIGNIQAKFAKKPQVADANIKVFKAGYHYGETAEVFQDVYEVPPAKFQPGIYRNITGNEATSLGLLTAAHLAEKQLFYSGYPITPASSILHSVARYKNYGAVTFQAEDEIAAVGAAIGAAYGGSLAVTASSGPGIALKGEGLGLAVITELPMVIISVQRGGPSTGLPTKTEQADLLQTLYGRNGEAPLPVLAAKTPGDCFYCAIEAVRIAVKYMVPVMVLTDGYLANGAEPWLVPNVDDLPKIDVQYRTDSENYQVYRRNPETLARDWVIPGTPDMQHRIGGLEKDFFTGNVSYDPDNHERMTRVRAEKVERVTQEMGPLDILGEEEGDVLVIGWGGTFGALRQATGLLREQGKRVSHVHLRWMFPFNPRLEPLLKNFRHVLVPELNMGQLRMVLRAKYLVDAQGLNKVRGLPFKVQEVVDSVERLLAGKPAAMEAPAALA
ncbi:2-oxoacid:acceptor oxidoreductase subunit alpha [Haliangium ochraceum]|uniref:Pyruvate flavodoxin/ferredoxin oxidoreductase domain protein n=1 Tax=Haliangium ochraceum (strain DSM 14365 / JCM 11303 / SMP-2) TaxID=502025 RepID=D0LGG7_HALO1|nr:2-oxoacid:acceptor oxidoreductase subunit alpha [Haliangium ochraceum]ACY12713.1 pyruvate flavodoxin/ferredoxin oxidoreductase domain protein [Haliangium ochraceum DSM 14365]